jgi:hypothetical protein
MNLRVHPKRAILKRWVRGRLNLPISRGAWIRRDSRKQFVFNNLAALAEASPGAGKNHAIS